jgi:hypothetical protein
VAAASGTDVWSDFYWSAPYQGMAEADIAGAGRNISIVFAAQSGVGRAAAHAPTLLDPLAAPRRRQEDRAMSLYNQQDIDDRTRADAEDVNAEFRKVKSAIDQLQDQLDALEIGAGSARYTWIAYARSDDGTVDFSLAPGTRRYIGIAVNKLTNVFSIVPADYTWFLFQGSSAPNISLTPTGTAFQFDANSNSIGLAQITITATGANLSTAITFAAVNDSGNVVALTAGVDANQKILTVADFGAAGYVNVTASADGGDVTAALQILRHVTTATYNPRGAYSNTATYAPLDTTVYNGGTYAALIATTGNAPSGTAQDNAYWQVIAAPGGSGAAPGALFTTTIDLTTTATGANLRSLADANGYDGVSDATVLFRVPNGVVVTGAAGAGVSADSPGNGGRAIDSGSWPVPGSRSTSTSKSRTAVSFAAAAARAALAAPRAGPALRQAMVVMRSTARSTSTF